MKNDSSVGLFHLNLKDKTAIFISLCAPVNKIFLWLLCRFASHRSPRFLLIIDLSSPSWTVATPGSTLRDLGRHFYLNLKRLHLSPSLVFFLLFPLLSWIDDGVIASPLALLRGRGGGGGGWEVGQKGENGSFSSAGPPSDSQQSHDVTNAGNVLACSRCQTNVGSAARLLRCTSRKKSNLNVRVPI